MRTSTRAPMPSGFVRTSPLSRIMSARPCLTPSVSPVAISSMIVRAHCGMRRFSSESSISNTSSRSSRGIQEPSVQKPHSVAEADAWRGDTAAEFGVGGRPSPPLPPPPPPPPPPPRAARAGLPALLPGLLPLPGLLGPSSSILASSASRTLSANACAACRSPSDRCGCSPLPG